MNNWFFGINAGISFNNGAPVSLGGGQLASWEGCSSVSSDEGNLLFYTDGIRIWNRQHRIMPGSLPGLNGDTIASQSSLIVRYPGSDSLYYVFTVGSMENNTANLSYSLVDLTLDNGFGDIIAGKKNILLVSPVCEKITAIKHANANDIYVLTHIFGSDEFYEYYINCRGLDPVPKIFAAGSVITGQTGNAIGYLKGSVDGSKVVMASLRSAVELFNFDNTTGELSFNQAIGSNPGNVCGPYGIEFSPDSKLLYLSYMYNCGSFGDYEIYQFRADVPDVNATKRYVFGGRGDPSGALQLGPDKKIYIAFSNSHYLGAINNPNVYGDGCNFLERQITLSPPALTGGGLPNAISGFTRTLLGEDSSLCGDNASLNITLPLENTSFAWNNGSVANSLEITSTGKYWTQIKTGENCIYADTLSVVITPLPKPDLGPDAQICPGQELKLDPRVPSSAYLWQDGSVDSVLKVKNAGSYSVTVTNQCGVGQDEVTIKEGTCRFMLPNAFTPDKASNNQFKMSNGYLIKDFRLNVYNRWGQLVFQTSDAQKGWQGNAKGSGQPPGSYVYMVTYTDPSTGVKESRKGTVLLIR